MNVSAAKRESLDKSVTATEYYASIQAPYIAKEPEGFPSAVPPEGRTQEEEGALSIVLPSGGTAEER